MFNSSNGVSKIIEPGTKAGESVGNATRHLVDISLSGRYAKRSDEGDEAYQTRLEFLGQKEALKVRRHYIVIS